MIPLEILLYTLLVITIAFRINKILVEKHNQTTFKHLYMSIQKGISWVKRQEFLKSPLDKPNPRIERVAHYSMALVDYYFSLCFFLYFVLFALVWIDAMYTKTASLKVTVLGASAILLLALLTRIYKVFGDKSLCKARHAPMK